MNKRNILKWITYILNMLLVLPIAGWMGIYMCASIKVAFSPRFYLPLWLRIIFPVLLLVPFMVLWSIYQCKSSKNYWDSIRLLLLTLYTWVSCSFLGEIKARIQSVILQDLHHYFWTLFERALATHPDFQSAVASMLTPDTHREVMQYIGANVWAFMAEGQVLISLGYFSLLLSWLIMLFLRKWKYRAWMVALLFPVGLALFGYGSYKIAFGKVMKTRSIVLFIRQKSAIVEMKKITPVMSNDAIISIVGEHAEKNDFGESCQYLIKKLERETQYNQDGK